MAYLDQNQRNNRPVVFTGVALLHAAAAYALVTGLAVTYFKEAMPVFEAKNYPIDQPPPPPPKPVKPQADRRTVIDNPIHKPVVPGPGPTSLPTSFPTPAPSPPPTPSIDPPTSRQTPTITPRLARPRGNPGGWATTNDYPARDLREGNQGVTRFSLVIGADGRVQSCAVTASSGFPGLDTATCDNVSRRARFEPATDGDGNAVIGSYSGSIRWVIPQD